MLGFKELVILVYCSVCGVCVLLIVLTLYCRGVIYVCGVIGAPFGQVLGDKILEKPGTPSDAEQMLQK